MLMKNDQLYTKYSFIYFVHKMHQDNKAHIQINIYMHMYSLSKYREMMAYLL